MAVLENGYRKTIFIRFCCCFKLSKKTEKPAERAADTCYHQMHTDWPCTIG